MKTLDDQIADIEKLDELRREARKLRQEAIDVLSAEQYLPKPRTGRAVPPIRIDWDAPGDDIEKAQMLRALRLDKAKNDDTRKENIRRLIDDLGSIEFAELHVVPALPPTAAMTIFRSCAQPMCCRHFPRCRVRHCPSRHWLASAGSFRS